jgi:hypothetical protein
VTSYTKDLHEALLLKSGQAFWKTWRYAFGNNTKHCMQVDGVTDSALVTDEFANFFLSQHVHQSVTECRNHELRIKYEGLRSLYEGCPINESELIGKLVDSIANGKAGGLDELIYN